MAFKPAIHGQLDNGVRAGLICRAGMGGEEGVLVPILPDGDADE